jgi:hypothetical protein
MKMFGGVDVEIHKFLTLSLDRGGQFHDPGYFSPGEQTPPPPHTYH